MKTLGISQHKLAILNNVSGSVMHALKKSDSGFANFGEIYFSKIKYKNIKAWKRHTKMTMNLVVPVGRVKFVFYSEEKNIFEEYILGENNYIRLTVNPLLWFGFQGMDEGKNLVMNIANIEHDPNEVERKNLMDLKYIW
tara:strand:+ start:111 stop:527 length:417 start_codon:yes stop_codon:yes gene_type:complete